MDRYIYDPATGSFSFERQATAAEKANIKKGAHEFLERVKKEAAAGNSLARDAMNAVNANKRS